jgi:hypothetical protein
MAWHKPYLLVVNSEAVLKTRQMTGRQEQPGKDVQ